MAQKLLHDGKGGVPLILACVDDVNVLVAIENVPECLQKIEEYGVPLGVVLNQAKTRMR